MNFVTTLKYRNVQINVTSQGKFYVGNTAYDTYEAATERIVALHKANNRKVKLPVVYYTEYPIAGNPTVQKTTITGIRAVTGTLLMSPKPAPITDNYGTAFPDHPKVLELIDELDARRKRIEELRSQIAAVQMEMEPIRTRLRECNVGSGRYLNQHVESSLELRQVYAKALQAAKEL